MNDIVIEKLLFRAPSPEPPPDLLQLLQTQIVLPSGPSAARVHANGWQNSLRRWFPALAFGLFVLSCTIILGVQANLIIRLRNENESLRAAMAVRENPKPNDSGADATSAQLAELAQLRADHDDLGRLRAEAEALRQQLNTAASPRMVNAPAVGADQTGESPEQRAQRESAECEMRLRQIGVAIRVWALDEGGRLPTSTIEMTNELGSPILLVCPGDHSHEVEVKNIRTIGWPAFHPELISYQFFLSGQKDAEFPERIIAKCPFHGHVLLADFSVVTNAVASGRYREVTIDGRLNLIKANPDHDSNR